MIIPILTLDKLNKNNRIYPREVMDKAIAKYKKEFVDERRAFVQRTLSKDTTVNLLDSVGVVKEIAIEGDKIVVDVEFFPNVPEGLMIETAVKNGHLFLRTAGVGSVYLQDDGTYKVGDDYEFISCFATDNPS